MRKAQRSALPVRGAAFAGLSVAAFLLSACDERFADLPEPWPGHHSHNGTVAQGSAFGVSIGMTRAEASAAMKRDPRFHNTAVFCSSGPPGAFRFDPKAARNGEPGHASCRPGDTTEDVWKAYPSILCVFCRSEIVNVSLVREKVVLIDFHD
jgi:hypothetical protein